MTDDVTLRPTWSGDWYKLSDPRPMRIRQAAGSMTLQDRWFYGPDDSLDIRFEGAPERGWGVWWQDRRIGFSAGDSIGTAKRKAVDLLKAAK